MCDPYVVTGHNYGRDTLFSKKPMSCLEAGHILPNGVKKTFFLFFFCRNANQILNTEINWIFAILQRCLVYTAPGLKFNSGFKILSHGQLQSVRILINLSLCRYTVLYSICRRRMLLKAYKPISLSKLKRDWRKVANKNEHQPLS